MQCFLVSCLVVSTCSIADLLTKLNVDLFPRWIEGWPIYMYILLYRYIYHLNKLLYMQIEMQIIISHISSSHLFVLVFYVIRKFSNARGKFWFSVWLVILRPSLVSQYFVNLLILVQYIVVIYSSMYLVNLFVPNLERR